MAIFKVQGENAAVFEGEHFSREIIANRSYSAERFEALVPAMVNRFRCCDDDGVTYFWGVCSSDSSFAPLDCLGEAYGCTYIEYKNPKTVKYEQL